MCKFGRLLKETKSATMNIFRFFFYFLYKSFVKVELSYGFTINLFTIAENCTEKLKTGVLVRTSDTLMGYLPIFQMLPKFSLCIRNRWYSFELDA